MLYAEAGSGEDEKASVKESEESEESEHSRCSSPHLSLKVCSKVCDPSLHHHGSGAFSGAMSGERFLHMNKVLVVYESYDKFKRKNVARERWCFYSDLELVRASPRKATRRARARRAPTSAPPARRRGAQALPTRPILTSRVFSMLKATFGDQQSDYMADYIQTAIMLSANKRLAG